MAILEEQPVTIHNGLVLLTAELVMQQSVQINVALPILHFGAVHKIHAIQLAVVQNLPVTELFTELIFDKKEKRNNKRFFHT